MAAGPRPTGRLQVVVITPDGSRRPAGLAAWLAAVAPRRARGDVTVALVSDRRMRSLNRTFRGVDRVTDVLSFPAFAQASAGEPANPSAGQSVAPPGRGAGVLLGDVVIATGTAARQARRAGHALGTELRVLALHGLLHLLGFDHEADDGAMAREERRLRRRGALREGLIERVSPAGGRRGVPATGARRRR